MKILSTNVYVGPSQYAHFPVIRHQVDIGALEDWPSAKLGDEFIDALVAALPGLAEHGCSYKEPGGFLRRLREGEGTWMAHIWEHATIELQNMAGTDVTFGRTRSIGEGAEHLGHYNMVFQYQQRDVGLEAARIARQLLFRLLPSELKAEFESEIEADFDFEEETEDFVRFAQRKELGPSTASLVRAAEERDIPWLRLNQYSLVQFGHGKYQQRIQATITSKTPHIAVEISCDKEDTHKLLKDLGLPVPQQIVVDISDLELGETVKVGDVVLPDGVASAMDPDETVAIALITRSTREAIRRAEQAEAGEGEGADGGEDAGGEG